MTNEPFKILAIDTALDGCGIGFSDNEKASVSFQPMTRGQSEVLLPEIIELLERHECEISDLDAVCVTLGPGSFTGSRVGLAAAQGITDSLNIPCLGYSTLEIVSLTHQGDVAVALDSKRGDAFFQDFNSDKSAKSEAVILSYEAVLKKTEQINLLTNIQDLNAEIFKGEDVLTAMLEKANEDLQNGDRVQVHLAPIYLRDAEVSKSKVKYREIG